MLFIFYHLKARGCYQNRKQNVAATVGNPKAFMADTGIF